MKSHKTIVRRRARMHRTATQGEDDERTSTKMNPFVWADNKPIVSIYRDFIMPHLCHFTEILQCPACVDVQRFYNALFVSKYRDFTLPCLCQFTEILQCSACVILQRFYSTLLLSIYRDFVRET